MCVVSMVIDHYSDKWGQWPYRQPYVAPFFPPQEMPSAAEIEAEQERIRKALDQLAKPIKPITQEEIDEFRQLLERAREYDKRNNEPECEMESKKQRLLDLAKELGIDISFV